MPHTNIIYEITRERYVESKKICNHQFVNQRTYKFIFQRSNQNHDCRNIPSSCLAIYLATQITHLSSSVKINSKIYLPEK